MSSAEDDGETIGETARRLLPLNAVISMSKEGDGWPSPLADAGFGLAGLEVPVRSTGALITVDAVLIRGRDDQLMLVEAKSGANLDAGQARKLDASRPEPVIRSASIQTSTAGRLPQPLAVFSCLEENSDRILQGIEGAGLDLPVISTGADVVQQRGAGFDDPTLDHAFRQDIDTGRPPPAYIALDVDASDEEFDDAVHAALVAGLARLAPSMDSHEVLKDVLPYADFLGKRARNGLRRRIEASMQRSASRQPDVFTYRHRTESRDWVAVHFLTSPESSDRRGRTQQYQALARAAQGPPRPGQHPGQITLDLEALAELDAENERDGSDAAE